MKIGRCCDWWIQTAAVGAAALVLAWSGSVSAQGGPPAVTVEVNENGNGTANAVALPLIAGIDCGGGVDCLVYDLTGVGAGGSMTPGFLFLAEPGCTDVLSFCLSDVLFFQRLTINDVLHPVVIFFSDAIDGRDSLADVNLLAANLSGVLGCGQASTLTNISGTFEACFINEIGPEGNNGATYIPTNATGSNGFEDPGFFNGRTLTYIIHSDTPTVGAAPEPATLALLGAGLLALGWGRRKSAK
jgi:hypothetical protein